jgi:hypothetical protein
MKFFADQRGKDKDRDIKGRDVSNTGAYQTGMLGIHQGRLAVEERDQAAKEKGLGYYSPRAGGAGGAGGNLRFLADDSGGQTVANPKTGEPMFLLTADGRKAPLGWSQTESQARKAGVVANYDAKLNVAYQGRDGNWYSTLAEATAATKRK